MVDQELAASENQSVLFSQVEPLSDDLIRSFMQVAHLTPGPNISGVLLIGNHYLGLGGIFLLFVALLIPSGLAMVFMYRLNQKLYTRKWFTHFKAGALAAVVGVLIYFLFYLAKKILVENYALTALFLFQVLFVVFLIRQKKVNSIAVTFGSGIFTWLIYSIFGGF